MKNPKVNTESYIGDRAEELATSFLNGDKRHVVEVLAKSHPSLTAWTMVYLPGTYHEREMLAVMLHQHDKSDPE